MEYVKGNPYFCKTKQIKQYAYLDKDISCDILIIGGGVDGAVLNFYLGKDYDVAVVDKSRFGYGCTSCATALLEYQLDEFANDLSKTLTSEQVVEVYNMGLNAFQRIANFVAEFKNECDFNFRPTLLYTAGNPNAIKKEFAFRKSHNFDCQMIDDKHNPFPFKLSAGILCENGGCEVNPYLLTKQLIENAKNQNSLFEHTAIDALKQDGNGYIATTNFGFKIKCKHVVLATGFNCQLMSRKLFNRTVSYSIVVSPNSEFGWYKKCLIHDCLTPYHYIRLLADGKVIFGGEDTKLNGEIKQTTAHKKYKKLKKDLIKMFPQLVNCTVENEFCGAFAETDNNLGIIGASKTEPNLFYFISCGANGIVNAFAGVDIIKAQLKQSYHPLSNLFSPDRFK